MKQVKPTKADAQKPTSRLDFLGQPPIIDGEDAAAYDELLARVRAAITPNDVIEEMLIMDVVQLQWEIQRWRGLKTKLMQACGLEALRVFLRTNLHYDFYSDLFADRLTQVIQRTFPANQVDDARNLAHACARNEQDAVDKVNAILARLEKQLSTILSHTRADEADNLVDRYARHESDAIDLVEEHFAGIGTTFEALIASRIEKYLDDIERIDRLTMVAEGRRNASLREIDRRRMVLGEILRRTLQEVEPGERRLLDPPTKRPRLVE